MIEIIRGIVKRVLHLHPRVTDQVLYTRKRYGGLGFPRLLTQIKFCGGWEEKLRILSRSLGMGEKFPPSNKTINRVKFDLKKSEHSRWREQGSQEVGVRDFRDDPVGNTWLLNGRTLPAWMFIKALQFTTNTYGTRIAIERANKTGVVHCRRCHTKLETLGHVLCECICTKKARIERHNAIVKVIQDRCTEKGHVVAREQSFRDKKNDLKKPDLVIKSRHKANIVDVTGVFENNNALAEAALKEINTYNNLINVVRKDIKATSGQVFPVVMGAKGAMPKAAIKILKEIGIDTLKLKMDIALRTSIEIAECHMDYG